MNSAGLFRDVLSLVSSHPLLERLFFASLEFAALAGLVWVAIRLARIKSARLMALLWLVVLAKPIVSLAVGSPLHVLRVKVDKDEIRKLTPPARLDIPAPPPLSTGGPGGVAQSTIDPPSPSSPHHNFFRRSIPPTDFANTPVAEPLDAAPLPTVDPELEPAPVADSARWNAAKFLIPLWLAGVAFFAVRSGLDRFQLRRLLRRTQIPDEALSAQYSVLAARLRIGRPPQLRVTDELESPALIGSLFPTILLPRWLAGGGDGEKIDWALRHELMHWKLLDPPAGLVREVAQGLFYFHPAAWWAGRHWEFAAELACDRAIITDADDSHAYATQLFGMLEEIRGRRQIAVRTGLFATRTQIAQRIAALVRGPLTTRAHLSALAIVTVLAISAVALSVGGTFAEKEPAGEPTIVVDETSEAEPSNSTSTSPSSATPGKVDLQLAAVDQPSYSDSAKSGESDPIVVRGRVLDPDGKPFAGGKVLALRITLPGRAYSERSEVVSRTDVNRDGTFTISMPPIVHRGLESSEFVDRRYDLVAIGDGFGPDWKAIDPENPANEVVLRLAADTAPIEGRILDLEGRPVAGVRVRLRSIGAAATKIDDWVAKASKSAPPRGMEALSKFVGGEVVYSMSPSPAEGGATLFPAVSQLIVDGVPGYGEATSGTDGRFKITGIGKDRLATLVMSGETIARTFVDVVTRPMSRAPMQGIDPRYRTPLYFGSKFDLTAEPTQIVTGAVRDADSGAPLRGVEVHLSQFGDSLLSVDGFLSSTSDADGRYRIVGIPRLSAASKTPIRLTAVPPPTDPYFVIEGESIPRPKDIAPIVHDIRLKRGCWVTGRVTDRTTGRPVPARVAYYPYLDNPHAREYSNFRADVESIADNTARGTSVDGAYRLPAIPGLGVVVALALDDEQYQVAAGAAEMGWKARNSSTDPRLIYHLFSPHIANSVRGVQIDEPAEETPCDIELVPYEREVIRLRDGDGRPLSGVVVAGALPRASMTHSFSMNLHDAPASRDDTVALLGLEKNPRRLLLMLHKKRRLGRAAIIERGKTREVRLAPCATFTGRVVDADGKSSPKTVVYATILPSDRPEPEEWPAVRPFVRGIESDDEGRFTLDLILPGMRYWVVAGAGTPTTVETVEPGQTIDVGTISTKEQEKKSPKNDAKGEKKGIDAEQTFKARSGSENKPPVETAENERTPKAVQPFTQATAEDDLEFQYAGTVVDPAGMPVAGAKVLLHYLQRNLPAVDAPADAVSDTLGQFRFSLRKSQFKDRGEKRWLFADLIAVKPGFGFAHAPSRFFETTGNLAAEKTEGMQRWLRTEWTDPRGKLALVADDVSIRGQLLNTNGRPVASVRVEVVTIRGEMNGTLDGWVQATRERGANFYSVARKLVTLATGYSLDGPRAAVIPPVQTDADGRFTLKGVGRDRIVDLVVSGPTIEKEMIHARSRPGETIQLPRTEWDSTPAVGSFICYPAEFTHSVAPSVPVEGRVTDKKTGAALRGVVIRAARSAMQKAGALNVSYIRTITDADGRYRLEGLPLGTSDLLVLPPPDAPQLPAAVTVYLTIRDKLVIQDEALITGVLANGRVVDERTGEPVTGRLTYYVYDDNPFLAEADRFHQALRLDTVRSEADGRFQVPLLAGKGILAFTADETIYPRGIGAEKLAGLEREGTFEFVRCTVLCTPRSHHLLVPLDIAPGTRELTVDMRLRSGVTISGRVLSPDGKPLSDFHFSGEIPSISWHRVKGNAFQVRSYFPEKGRWLMFYHPGTNLVGLHELIGDPPAQLEVTLHPGATITGRVVGADGQPVENLLLVPSESGSQPDFPEIQTLAALDKTRGNPITFLDEREMATDREGRFEIKGIIPGLKYSVGVVQPANKQSLARHLGRIFTDVTAQAGERKDLGDLRLKSVQGAP